MLSPSIGTRVQDKTTSVDRRLNLAVEMNIQRYLTLDRRIGQLLVNGEMREGFHLGSGQKAAHHAAQCVFERWSAGGHTQSFEVRFRKKSQNNVRNVDDCSLVLSACDDRHCAEAKVSWQTVNSGENQIHAEPMCWFLLHVSEGVPLLIRGWPMCFNGRVTEGRMTQRPTAV